MTFKKPEKSYLSYKINLDKKIQEEKALLEKKQVELLAKKFIIDFKKILQLISYTDSDFIPLDSFYGWKEIAIKRYGQWTGTKLIEKIQEKLNQEEDPCVDNITFCNLNDSKEI